MIYNSDFLVIGSGIAGLIFALEASKSGTVNIITKRSGKESNTYYAQGGIASVLSPQDSFQKHIQDTLNAGDGICNYDAVRLCVEYGPELVKKLMNYGVKFTKRDDLKADASDDFDLGKEGGHTSRRILHADDFTGMEISRALLQAIDENPNIDLIENSIAIDLISKRKLRGGMGENQCLGAYVLDTKKRIVKTYIAKVTTLATGGAGKVYLYTSNPDIATGDGIAMAYRLGAWTANMEFFQFHPTCLYHVETKSFLISEALRGEGGVLRLKNGEKFMKKYHDMCSLAPRDTVARAIDHELKKSGDNYVLLDMTHVDGDFLQNRFPNIFKKCKELGIDMRDEPLPVVPAAHYSCGGILTNQWAETSIKGLFACGESACTGLHGANRLASNSLLEAVVFAYRAAQKAQEMMNEIGQVPVRVAPWDVGNAEDSDERVVVTQNWEEIRRFMWNYVGIVRSNKRLQRAKRRIEIMLDEIKEYYWDFIITSDLIELRNIATCAHIIINSALQRQESRGLHYNIDFPKRDDVVFRRDTIFKKES